MKPERTIALIASALALAQGAGLLNQRSTIGGLEEDRVQIKYVVEEAVNRHLHRIAVLEAVEAATRGASPPPCELGTGFDADSAGHGLGGQE
jgi:hypothetical protein